MVLVSATGLEVTVSAWSLLLSYKEPSKESPCPSKGQPFTLIPIASGCILGSSKRHCNINIILTFLSVTGGNVHNREFGSSQQEIMKTFSKDTSRSDKGNRLKRKKPVESPNSSGNDEQRDTKIGGKDRRRGTRRATVSLLCFRVLEIRYLKYNRNTKYFFTQIILLNFLHMLAKFKLGIFNNFKKYVNCLFYVIN